MNIPRTSYFKTTGRNPKLEFLFFLLLFISVMNGCSSEEKNSEVKQKLAKYHSDYLSDEVDVSKRGVLNTIALLEGNDFKNPLNKPSGLMLAYARLFVIYSNNGDEKKASDCHKKFNHWRNVFYLKSEGKKEKPTTKWECYELIRVLDGNNGKAISENPYKKGDSVAMKQSDETTENE